MEISSKSINMDNIKPCYKSINELEEYLLVNYNAKLMKVVDERTLKFEKYNIVKQKFPSLLKEDIDEITYDNESEEKLLSEIDRISELPKNELDLDIVQYNFDVVIEENIIGSFEVIIERNTEYVNPRLNLLYDNYKNKLMGIMAGILLYQGVTKIDIDTKSERFFKYVITRDFYSRYI